MEKSLINQVTHGIFPGKSFTWTLLYLFFHHGNLPYKAI